MPYAVLLDKYTILGLPSPPNYLDLEHQLDVLTARAWERNKTWTAPCPRGPARDGFDIAMAVEVASTAWRPGQQSIKDSLGGAQLTAEGRAGFEAGMTYHLSRTSV